eukprot:2967256-Lingulodinium_polyedra.AAC.1
MDTGCTLPRKRQVPFGAAAEWPGHRGPVDSIKSFQFGGSRASVRHGQSGDPSTQWVGMLL